MSHKCTNEKALNDDETRHFAGVVTLYFTAASFTM